MNMELEIKKIIQESSSDLAEMVKTNLKKDLVSSLTWNVREEVSKIVKNYFETELKEEIKEILESSKPELKMELEKAIINVAAEAGKSLREQAIKNLSSSWNVQKLAETLFK